MARMLWHKLYSSSQRTADPSKAAKDLHQAATLAALLSEQDSASLRESIAEAPAPLRRAARAQLPRLEALLAEHPQALDECRALGTH